MELKIIDLLDDIQDIPLDIPVRTTVSETRVKELTMKKLYKETNTQAGRSGRFLTKTVVLAAVLICLSVTVLAAVGNYIPQQLSEEQEETVGYDNDLYIGSASKNWGLGGWLMELKAEAASASGLTMVCMEWGGQGQTGTLTTVDAYWLEKWNGSGYDVYLPEKTPAASGSTITIQPNTTISWSVNWTECFGTLTPGNYRLGKIFRHTSDSGEIQDMAGYVKFRVFEDDIASCYSQYETALNALYDQHSWHLTWQVFPEDPNGYTSYSQEIWKSDKNYLENLCYLDADDALLRHSGLALRDGMGYRLTWAGGRADSEITQCKPDDSVSDSRFYLWHTFLSPSGAYISEITREGNTIIFQSETNWETVLTLNDAGQIQSIRQYQLRAGEKILYSVLTVHDTAPAQIAQIIGDQNLDTPQTKE